MQVKAYLISSFPGRNIVINGTKWGNNVICAEAARLPGFCVCLEGEREKGHRVRHVITCYPWWMAISSHSTGSYRGPLFLFSFISVLVWRTWYKAQKSLFTCRNHPTQRYEPWFLKASKTLYSYQLHQFTTMPNYVLCCAVTGCFAALIISKKH